MKFVLGKHKKAMQTAGGRPRVVLSLNFDGIQKFTGFSHSVEEGKRLSQRSYTELPDFGRVGGKPAAQKKPLLRI